MRVSKQKLTYVQKFIGKLMGNSISGREKKYFGATKRLSFEQVGEEREGKPSSPPPPPISWRELAGRLMKAQWFQSECSTIVTEMSLIWFEYRYATRSI